MASSNTGSRVVDALSGDALMMEKLLLAVGAGQARPHGVHANRKMHCPMPDHADNDPSCDWISDGGFLVCRTRCGVIRAADLVMAYGKASSPSEALRWAEEALGLDAAQLRANPVTRIDDPSLSVAQYLAMKRLSKETATRFGLVDAQVWEDASRRRKGYDLLFETGYHGCVLMPNDPPDTPFTELTNRPRVRNVFGARWPARVRVPPATMNFSRASEHDSANALAYPQHAYGIPQMEPSPDAMLRRCVILVEGESDVHALHDMGVKCCLGLPGTGGAAASIPSVIGAILSLEGGDTATLKDWSLLVWSEPGDPGQELAGRVAKAVAAQSEDLGGATPPRVAQLQHSSIVVDGETAKDPCDLLGLVANLHNGSLEPARVECGRLVTQAAFTALGQNAADLDPDAPAQAIVPCEAALPDPASMQRGSDPWEDMGCDGSLPHPEAMPRSIKVLGMRFERIGAGWLERYTNAKEEECERYVSTIFDVARVELIAGEEYVMLRAPRAPGDAAPELATTRILRSDVPDSRIALRALASIGVTVTPRCGPQAVTLISALAERELRTVGATRIAETTGWRGTPGVGDFAGIECDTSAELGAQMFRANERRRKMRPDVSADAAAWWAECVAPLITPLPSAAPRQAAPLLAIGAAASAPLLGPLTDLGVGISPVIWLAGMGGGGKSITQDVCAAIFAPDTASLNGQEAYSISSNITLAAIGARAESLRDLPIVLDDIGNLPPSSNSKLTGEAATIYAGAELGMMLFNRDRAQRATRDGKSRSGADFRSPAIFSTELEMGASSNRSTVKAGHFRRITAMDAQPMFDRGLKQGFAEAVKRAAQTTGGAAGDLLIPHIRAAVEAGTLEASFVACRAAIDAMDSAADVDLTQRESLAITMLGFTMLAAALGVMSEDDARAYAAQMIAPFVSAPSGEGGAMKACDITGVDRAVRAVQDLVASNPLRFENSALKLEGVPRQVIPLSGYLGRDMGVKNGVRTVFLTRDGTNALESKYGVSDQAISQAVQDGVAKRNHPTRIEGKVIKGTLWLTPSDGGYDPDDEDTQPPHDPDPYGLKDAPRIPGAAARVDKASDEPASIAPARSNVPPQQTGTPAAGESDTLEDYVPQFNWANQLYDPLPGEALADIEQVIRDESEQELLSLKQMARAWDIKVPDAPAADDPRWEKIDAFGKENARSIVKSCASSLTASQTAPEKDRPGHLSEYVRNYRLYLLARMRQPGWFVHGGPA